MRFLLVRSENQVIVDNADVHIDTSSLPPNVEMVVYQETEGKIEYNDRPSARTKFTDPSPYQPFINAWMIAFAAQTPALTLEQAKQVKIDLVDAIYQHKRRLPYTYNGNVYEASDEAVMNMTAAMVSGTSGDTGGLVGSVNAALAALTSQVNSTVVAGANAMVAANNGSAAAVNGWSANLHANWSIVLRGGDNIWRSLSNPNISPGYGGFASMAGVGNISGAAVAAGGGAISWQPIGYPNPIAIPGSELSGALGSIVARRNALNNNRVDKQAAINALTTIAQCAAYDATTGWSF